MSNLIIGFEEAVTQLASGTIPLQIPALPPITTYCTPMRIQGPICGGKVAVPVVTTVQSVQTNPTSFENSNDVVGSVEPTLYHYSAQFGFNSPNYASGLALERLMASHLVNIQLSIQTLINGVVNASNFSSPVVTVASGSYSVANLETLLASVPARTICALNSAYFVKTKSTWMPSGEEDKLKELSFLTGVGTNIEGFVARPEAIAVPFGYPVSGPPREVTASMIRLPIGLDVQFSRWYKRDGRAWRGSLDICIAAEVGQVGALRLLASA